MPSKSEEKRLGREFETVVVIHHEQFRLPRKKEGRFLLKTKFEFAKQIVKESCCAYILPQLTKERFARLSASLPPTDLVTRLDKESRNSWLNGSSTPIPEDLICAEGLFTCGRSRFRLGD